VGDRPVIYDLCCGKGGWATGFLAEGWDFVGFDVEDHGYPGRFVRLNVFGLHASHLRDGDCIMASPPRQEFSRWDIPQCRAKNPPPPDARRPSVTADESGDPLLNGGFIYTRGMGRNHLQRGWNINHCILWGRRSGLVNASFSPKA